MNGVRRVDFSVSRISLSPLGGDRTLPIDLPTLMLRGMDAVAKMVDEEDDWPTRDLKLFRFTSD